MLGVMLLAAIGWFFTKNGASVFGNFEFMAWRFGFGALLLFILRPQIPAQADLKAGLQIGLVFFISMVFWISAVGRSTFGDMGLGGFIVTLGVVLSPYLGKTLFNEAIKPGYFLAVILAGIGGLLMAPGFTTNSVWLYVSAAFCLALYMTLMTRLTRTANPWAMTTTCFIVVTLGMALLSLAFEPRSNGGFAEGWLWLLLSVTIATAFRFMWQAKVQGHLPQSEASLIMNLEGVAVAAIATFFSGVFYGPLQWLGAGLILSALFLRFTPKRSKI